MQIFLRFTRIDQNLIDEHRDEYFIICGVVISCQANLDVSKQTR